jgi:diketogulonate reductase-like aldo/keto reductase
MQDKLPKLALGTWLMGGAKDPDLNNDDARDISIIQTAIDSGITLIDTAQNYAAGKCEELVGRAIAEYPREQVQILTKQGRQKLSYDEVIAGCHGSLKRLGVNYIDYFVCHAPNPDLDMRDFFKACNQLYKEGLIRHVGVSNFGVASLQIAMETSEIPIALNQVSFSVSDSDILTSGTYDFCVKNNIAMQAYRPLALIREDIEMFTLLEIVSKEIDLTPHQVALAYLNSYENMHFTIRASTKKHWDEIRSALNETLRPEHLGRIKKLHLTKKGVFGHFLKF